MAGKPQMLAAGLAFIAITGCAAKQRLEDLPQPPRGTVNSQQGNSDINSPLPGSTADFLARVRSDRVYFATDRSDIDSESQSILASQAVWLKRFPNVRITLEGHCDERGTRDYNIALGARRANAAKNFLAAEGINPARVTTVSYGKERPEALGSDEESWARNRRAVTVTLQ